MKSGMRRFVRISETLSTESAGRLIPLPSRAANDLRSGSNGTGKHEMANALVSARGRRSGNRSPKPKSKAPVLATTQYDFVSALLIALLIAFVVLTIVVTALWLINRRIQTDDDIAIEMLNLGGYEDGAPDETLKVESPEDPTDDPAVVDTPTEETQVQETIENVITDSAVAAQQVPPQTQYASENSGKIGSREGTGRRPLGSLGGDGNRAQRWFIRYGDQGTIEAYAKQLDHFGVELGLLQDKRIYRLSNLSQPTATKKIYTSGKEFKNQHYFTWAGGGRKKADIKLFLKKGGLKASRGIIFHFYPKKTIRTLLQLEKKESDRPVNEIQRTYFLVQKDGDGFKFIVTKITYK